MSLTRHAARSRRRGSYAVVFALIVMVVMGFAALTVDVGFQSMARVQLENALDAAAHAGASYLDGTEAGLVSARDMAVSTAVANKTAGMPVVLDANEGNNARGDVVLGYWDFDTGTFVPSTDAEEVDTVVVTDTINLGTLLGGVAFGQDIMVVSSQTAAYRPPPEGAGAVECYLPFAIPQCMLDTHTEAELQSLRLVLNPAGIDTAGWARLNNHPNASWVRDQISNCQNDGEIAVGDQVGLNNGVIASGLSALATAISSSDTSWDTDRWGAMPSRASRSAVPAADYGNTVEGSIIVFDGGPDYCTGSGGSYTGSEPVVGFIWVAVYDVVSTGPASGKNVYMRMDLSENHSAGTRGGGVDAAVVYTPPAQILY